MRASYATDNPWLASLKPIFLPEMISWWPDYIIWPVMLILLFLARYACAWYQKQQAERYRQQGLKEIQQYLKADLSAHTQIKLLRRLPKLARELALQLFPKQQIIPLQGQQWQDFLNASTPTPAPLPIDQLAYWPESKLIAVEQSEVRSTLAWMQMWLEGVQR